MPNGLTLLCLCLQEATEASYVATMKTIRQVKTVFVIFIAFVCCWSPYIVVLLYDTTDVLPLPVHLYASMLAHLHASLNFAIYSLMNPNLRRGFVTFVCEELDILARVFLTQHRRRTDGRTDTSTTALALMNPNLRTGFVTRLVACCRRVTSDPSSSSVGAASGAAAGAAPHGSTVAQRRGSGPGYSGRRLDVNRSFAAVEYQQFQEVVDTATETTSTRPSTLLGLTTITSPSSSTYY